MEFISGTPFRISQSLNDMSTMVSYRMKIGLIGLIILISSCVKKNSDEKNRISGDSLFHHKNIQMISNRMIGEDYDSIKGIYNLVRVSQGDVSKLTSRIFGSEYPYEAFYYAINQPKSLECTLEMILVNTDEFSSIYLFGVGTTGTVNFWMELTKDGCFSASRINNREMLLCKEKSSQFLNDSTVLVNDLSVQVDGYGLNDQIDVIDSISNVYRIHKAGDIKILTKDSTRYLKRHRAPN